MIEVFLKKGTAVWLVDNTSLTFEQIAEFCELSLLDIQTIADGEYEIKRGCNPVLNGQLTIEEIERCQKDPKAKIQLHNSGRYDAQKVVKKRVAKKPPADVKDFDMKSDHSVNM